MSQPAKVYTPETLAEAWHCSSRHVRNLVNKGDLRAFRLGGKLIRIPVDAVEEYLCQHTVSANSESASSSTSTTTPDSALTVIDFPARTRAELNAKRREFSQR